MRSAVYVLVAAVALTAGLMLSQRVEQNGATMDASSIYDSRLYDLDGSARSLRDWDGKVLLVNFWATWCAPCRQEIPLLQGARERYRDQNLEIIGIALDHEQPVRSYRDEMAIAYPLLLALDDPIGMLSAFGNESGALPHSAVVGTAGEILATHTGLLTESQLEALIQNNLKL